MEKQIPWCGLDSCGSRQGPVAGRVDTVMNRQVIYNQEGAIFNQLRED
jgi:hypothetical protein